MNRHATKNVEGDGSVAADAVVLEAFAQLAQHTPRV